MEKPVYFGKDQVPCRVLVLGSIVTDLEGQFKIKTNFNEISYTVGFKRIKNETGIGTHKAVPIVTRFLRSKKKRFEPKSGGCGSRYLITVSREELKEWKEDIENLRERMCS